MKTCELCKLEHDGSYGSGRFCSHKCARSFSTKSKRVDINEKVSKAAKDSWNRRKKDWVEKLTSIMDIVNNDVKRKILRAMNIGCSRCGWNLGSCDFHHINGRKIKNYDDQVNVTYICPNCHRLFHEKKIGPKDVLSLAVVVEDRWKKYYMRF